jgi:hypothetical protein
MIGNYKCKSFSITFFLIVSLLSSSVVFAQNADGTKTNSVNTVTLPDDGSSNDSINSKDITRWSILGGTIPVVYLYGLKTWDWGSRHSPRSEREYWFGEDTSFGGADKAGHFYAHYMIQRGMYQVFNWTEDGGNMKWPYSIGTTMITGLFIEVGDAYTSSYGFSFEDIVIDYAGILFGAALDYSPMLDGFLGFSSSYVPSENFRKGFGGDKVKYTLDFVNDYSGWEYTFNFKIAGFKNLGFDVPLVLRLLNVDFGFDTKGYTKYDNGRFPHDKQRNIFLGLSINSAQLLSEIWPVEHRNKLYTASHTFLEYYRLPYQLLPEQTRLQKDLNK